MPWWAAVLDAVVICLVLLLAYAAAIVVRRKVISRNGGTFELSHRVVSEQDHSNRAPASEPGRGWVLGIGRYSGETLEWFRFFSVWPGPRRTWRRTDLAFEASRAPEGEETAWIYADHVIVICSSPAGTVEFAMTEASLIGFQAWLESRNPGTNWSTR